MSLVELTFKPKRKIVATRSIIGKEEYSNGSFMKRQTSKIITERDMFNVNKISSSIGGSGIIIMATITTMPIAMRISLFFKKLANAPRFIFV